MGLPFALPQLMSGIPESLQQEITKFMTAGAFNLVMLTRGAVHRRSQLT